jgi:hypothetical protein
MTWQASLEQKGNDIVATYSGGMCFGELALLYNSPRAATVTRKTIEHHQPWPLLLRVLTNGPAHHQPCSPPACSPIVPCQVTCKTSGMCWALERKRFRYVLPPPPLSLLPHPPQLASLPPPPPPSGM